MSDAATTTIPDADVSPATRTTIYDKLPPDLRREVDQAIADRSPPTYNRIYDKFHLDNYGINLYAFYRYARKLRTKTDRLYLAELTLPDDADLGDIAPRLIGQQLLDLLLYEETPSPQTIYRLTRAYRSALEAGFAKRRFAAQFENDERKTRAKEADDLLLAARRIAKAQATENHIQAAVAREAKAAFKGFEQCLNPPAIKTRASSDTPSHQPSPPTCASVSNAGAKILSRTHSSGNPFPFPPIDREQSPSAGEGHSLKLSTQHSELSTLLPGLSPPLLQRRSSTTLSQRREDRRRNRRRERQRRRRR